jgi:hypothetical protein
VSETSTKSNVEVLQQYWEATTTGNIPLLKPVIADDAVFHYPGQHYLSGDYHGVEGVAGLYTTVTSLGQELFQGKLRGLAATPDDSYNAVILSYRIKVFGNKWLPGRATGLFRISGGKIHEYWLHEWDQQMINDIWWASAPKILRRQKKNGKILLSLPRITLGGIRTLRRVFGGYKAPTEPH